MYRRQKSRQVPSLFIYTAGLLGLCEISDYAEGTKAMMNFLANRTASAGILTLICGGHTVRMVEASAYAKCFTRVSRVYDSSLLQMLESKKPKGDIVRSQSF
jgi:3-phosphoglycerate kinase